MRSSGWVWSTSGAARRTGRAPSGRSAAPSPRTIRGWKRTLLSCKRSFALAALLATALGCATAAEDHYSKGNRFLADGKPEDARAEFRIVLRRSRRAPEELLWKLGLLDLDA